MIKKAELHVHLEGTATPALVKRIAARNQITLPVHLQNTETHFHWDDFMHFLQVYEDASSVIKQPIDYYDITYEYLKSCAKEGAIYVEMMYSPEHAERSSGLPSHEHLLAIEDAINHARRDYQIEGRILITCVRHYGVEAALKVAKDATIEKNGYIVGFGMAGDEAGFPPGQFAAAFEIAHAAGLPCTVHAGEMAGPESIREALNTLPIRRLGHGVRIIEDRHLLDEVLEKDITFEVCPNSNIVLGVYPSFDVHPLPELIASGAKVTLNSDDPPYFSTSIAKEYQTAQECYNLSDLQLKEITKTAILSSFADQQTKNELIKRV